MGLGVFVDLCFTQVKKYMWKILIFIPLPRIKLMFIQEGHHYYIVRKDWNSRNLYLKSDFDRDKKLGKDLSKYDFYKNGTNIPDLF